jgi:crotonobetainyl-CoA:carnitine CoA-transferase CaiB-like acyl-CoA transferase
MAVDSRFTSNHARVEHRAEMLAVIRPIMTNRTTAEWEAIFRAEGIPHSRVLTIAQLVESEQFREAGMLQPAPHPDVPELQLIDLPVTHNHNRTSHPTPPPRLGEHNVEVLGDFGYAETERVRLEKAGALG